MRPQPSTLATAGARTSTSASQVTSTARAVGEHRRWRARRPPGRSPGAPARTTSMRTMSIGSPGWHGCDAGASRRSRRSRGRWRCTGTGRPRRCSRSPSPHEYGSALQRPSGPHSGVHGSTMRGTQALRGQSSQPGQLGDADADALRVAAAAFARRRRRARRSRTDCGSKWPSPSASTSVRKPSPSSTSLTVAGDQVRAVGREHGAHRGAALGVGRGGAHQAPRHLGDHLGAAVVADDDRHDELDQVAVDRLGDTAARGGRASGR